MIAGILFLLCSLALFELLDQTYQMTREAMVRVTLNSEARNLFHTLADGGKANTEWVPGYHGHQRDPWSHELTITDDHRWKLQNADGDATLLGRSYPDAFDLDCQGEDTPLKSCVDTPDHTIAGYVDKLTTLPSPTRSVGNKTIEVSFTVMEPEQVFITMEKKRPRRDYSETFWTVFTLGTNKKE
ncbi:MAG: hypothetical protein H7829_00185 [Magnetococcus sp. THC-1_WYH]